jgi:hypothetical protein
MSWTEWLVLAGGLALGWLLVSMLTRGRPPRDDDPEGPR